MSCFSKREKTSQAFRDALNQHYKSSNSTKTKRRLSLEQVSSLRRYSSEASLASIAHAHPIHGSTNKATDALMSQLETELGTPFTPSSVLEESARSVLDLYAFKPSSSNVSQGPLPVFHSCPELTSSSSSSVATNDNPSLRNWNLPLSNMNYDMVPQMTCVRPSEPTIRLFHEYEQIVYQGIHPHATLPNTMASTMFQHANGHTNQKQESPQGGCEWSNGDLFNTLMKMTDGCAADGDPFEPVPLR